MSTIAQDRQTVTSVEFLGEASFPNGFIYAGTEVGGLSGLVYDPDSNVYYALSDDRSQINPARFYTLTLDLSDGTLEDGDITFTNVTTLLDASGQPFPDLSLDPEGIALTSDGTLYIASEGDANRLIDPFVNAFSLAGQQLSELPISAKFLPQADQSSGIRNNLAFESLTLSPDGRFLYTATENALFQDGPAATLDTGSLARIVQYDLGTGAAVTEFVYEVDSVPEAPTPADAFTTNGLVELLATDNNGSFLALERGFSVGAGNTVKLYEVRSQGALDVITTPDLFREYELEDDGEIIPPGPFEIDPAVTKRELLDIEADLGILPDNLEALAFGPTLADGRQTLIIASDNNFNATQVTQFLAFAVDFDTIPAVPSVLETPYTVDDDRFLEQEPLDILLVNDDGYEADGITVLYDALVAAGHTVTFVAPKEQQSGQGTRISVDAVFQPTEVVEFEPNKWYVDATPVTTTQAALDFILDGEAPDLVISGINEGDNVGANIAISSGTVSAAATAIQRGIPAIAVSAGTVRDEAFNIDEEALAAAYDFGAGFVVDLVDHLVDSQGENAALLPDRVGLNVNIPGRVEAIEGTALTVLDETGTFDLFVGDIGFGPSLLFSASAPLEPEDITVPDSEGQNFLADFVTITPIDGDWTASNNVRQQLSDRIAEAPVDAVATPLNILITNDDGFAAEGIRVLHNTLTAAGHTVTLVGPEEQQSGTGTALDTDKILQPLEIVNTEGDKWFVDAGVRTTTWAGLDSVLGSVAPDLVISGINEGENIGPGGAVSSGTVSAAVTALLREVPAIAISAGIDLLDPTGAGTSRAYEIGAEFVTDLIAKLQATQGEGATLLPPDTGLSINIPVRFPEGVDDVQGAVFTNASDITPFIIDFGPIDASGNVGLRFVPFDLPADAEVDPTSEGGQFLSGFITVTPFDGDWTAPAAGQEQVAALLNQPTPELLGDSDDPAIWVNPTNPDDSLVIVTLKDGGAATFNLQGEIKQTILPADFGDIRYNNVDLIYGFALGDTTVDLAVFSDRANDTLAIYQIDPTTRQLSDITADSILETIFGVDDGEATAYGLVTYVSPVTGKSYVFTTQADGNLVAQLELVDNGDGTVSADLVRTIALPVPTGDVTDSQSEGLVADQELGFLYVALENEVGILKFSAEPDGGNDSTLVQAIDADFLEPDLEGLTIYYGADGNGYLIASSQGNNSFAVFTREGDNDYLGSFTVGDTGAIDQVNESDGLDVTNVALGTAFPNGLLVVQDGANDPQNVAEDDEELENNSTNFKFVDWAAVSGGFGDALAIAPTSFNPRQPTQALISGTQAGETLVGNGAVNMLNAFGGNDTVAGEMGNDVIYGGEGDDVLRGDRNSHKAGGTIGGNDVIYGGAGSDRIGGKAGNDQLFGGSGDDQIWGDDGDDILRGGLGADTLTGDNTSGGSGSDTFILALGEGTDTILDYGNGADVIQVLGTTAVSTLQQGDDTLILAGEEVLAVLVGYTDTVTVEIAGLPA